MKISRGLTIVIATIVYADYTGVELYIYELSRQLKSMGHRVIVLAPEPSGDIVERTKQHGVEVYSFENCPESVKPDVLHLNEQLPTMFALARWPNTPAVATIHSQFPVEAPFISERISRYICIRQEIVDHIRKNYPSIENRLTLIHNGFDFNRFRSVEPIDVGRARTIIFVGTIDSIRKKSIEHLIQKTKDEGYKLKVVGKKYEPYLDNPPSHVEVLGPRWDVEKLFTKDVVATAGVLLGRSTIEGWIAGREGWIYDIETDGTIKSLNKFPIPDDIDKFNSEIVAEEITKLYHKAIDEKSVTQTQANSNGDLNKILAILTNRSIVNGNTTYSLIKKMEYLEGILASHGDEITHLIDDNNLIKQDVEKAHERLLGVERALPTNIYRAIRGQLRKRRKQ